MCRRIRSSWERPNTSRFPRRGRPSFTGTDTTNACPLQTMTEFASSEIDCAVQSQDEVGESPIWCPQSQQLFWVDVYGPTLHTFDPSSGKHSTQRLPAALVGSIGLRKSGGLILAANDGLFGFDPIVGRRELVADPERNNRNLRLNDGKCDRRGRFWVGSMNFPERLPCGSFYRIDPDGNSQWLFGDLIIPNSTAFSPDDRTVYFGDSRQFKIWSFDLDIDTGRISGQRVFRDFSDHPGRPDGSTIDETGCLWNAEIAGHRVVRYTPSGEIDRVIQLPISHPTCCAFGGKDLDVLFVTSAKQMLTPEERLEQPLAGSLFAMRVGVRGIPEPSFAG